MPDVNVDGSFRVYGDLKTYASLRLGLTRGAIEDSAKKPVAKKPAAKNGQGDSGGNDRLLHVLLENAFEARGPWRTKFKIAGKTYGGRFDSSTDPRLRMFLQNFPNAGRVLELSCLEGGHSIVLAAHPGVQSILAIEGRQHNVDKARLIKKIYGAGNLRIIQANLETENLEKHGAFDTVYCSGLLYHLPNPQSLLARIVQVTRTLYLSTHVAEKNSPDLVTRNGVGGKLYKEGGIKDPLSGMSETSFWPTFEGLEQMLRKSGFNRTEQLEYREDHPSGPLLTLIARRI